MGAAAVDGFHTFWHDAGAWAGRRGANAMLQTAVAIAALMTVVNYLAGTSVGVAHARTHEDYPLWMAPLSGLLTIPASLLWFSAGGFLGFAAAGEGGALAAVVVEALLDGLGLLVTASFLWDMMSAPHSDLVASSHERGGDAKTKRESQPLRERWKARLREKKRRPSR
jgi:hypothetical protein